MGRKYRALLLQVALFGAFALPVATSAQPRPSRDAIAAPALPGEIELPIAAGTPQLEVWHHDGTQVAVRNVTRPTLVPVLPVGKTGGPAVIVAPGGAFLGLAIEKEGWDVARWLANHGVAAFVLKYRLVPTGTDQAKFADQMERMLRGERTDLPAIPSDTPPEALADGLAALRQVRGHAAEYGVDPHKIGFMGFSAGGFLTRSVVAEGGADAPDFAAPIYPNMAALEVPASAPPMFVAIAADDFLLAPHKGFPLIESYRNAGRPIEFHLFASGGHGFGLGQPGTPPAAWPELFLDWLKTIGMVAD